MEENILTHTISLQVDNANIPYLSEAAKWAKFLAVIGFIFCAFMLIIGVLAGTTLSSYFIQRGQTGYNGNFFAMGSSIVAVIYIILGLLYFFPCLYLFSFAGKMQSALRNTDQVNLNMSFKNLKSCFKFWGMVVIILVCIYAIVFIFGIVASVGLNH